MIVVSDGVVAERVPLEGVGEVVVLGASLAKDLGENHVLRNAEFERLLGLAEAARREHPFVSVVTDPSEPAAKAVERRGSTGFRVFALVFVSACVYVLAQMDEGATDVPGKRSSAALSTADQLFADLQRAIESEETFVDCTHIATNASYVLRKLSFRVTIPGSGHFAADIELERFNHHARSEVEPELKACLERSIRAVSERTSPEQRGVLRSGSTQERTLSATY